MSDRRFIRFTSLIGRTMVRRARPAILAAASISGLFACQGVIGDPPGAGNETGAGATPSGGATTTPTGTGGAGGSAGTDPGTAGSAGAPGGSGGAGAAATLPARIRRLTNAEYDASVRSLLGIDSKFGATFTPDARQDGFTRNDAQRVDPVFTMQIDDAATELAAQAKSRLSELAPCANPTSGGEACAASFLGKFAARAYRRPAVQREIDALLAVYRAGAEGAAYADGIEAAIHGVLVSPGFLYVTEIGNANSAATAATLTLTPYEAASSLAYLLTGAPPDEELYADAANGEILKPAVRERHTRRLFASPAAAAQTVRVVQEWLGIDRITETGKDSKVYPEFAGLRDAMKREADAFVGEVMWKTSHDVGELLSADWTIADPTLAQMYGGVAAGGRVSLANAPRRGVLNQGAFLSVYAHAHESGPVLRGVAMLRRLACVDMASPTSLNLNVVPPIPDPTKTTRERFAVHTTDPVCANCHKKIDAFGFAFENFDGMGKARVTEGVGANQRPVDSSTSLALGMDFDGSYPDSSAIVVKMATSSIVRACFARHLFRAAAASSARTSQPAEEGFVAAWSALPVEKQRDMLEVLVAWLGSESFLRRRIEP